MGGPGAVSTAVAPASPDHLGGLGQHRRRIVRPEVRVVLRLIGVAVHGEDFLGDQRRQVPRASCQMESDFPGRHPRLPGGRYRICRVTDIAPAPRPRTGPQYNRIVIPRTACPAQNEAGACAPPLSSTPATRRSQRPPDDGADAPPRRLRVPLLWGSSARAGERGGSARWP